MRGIPENTERDGSGKQPEISGKRIPADDYEMDIEKHQTKGNGESKAMNDRYAGYIVLNDGRVYNIFGTLAECIAEAEEKKQVESVEKIVLRKVDD